MQYILLQNYWIKTIFVCARKLAIWINSFIKMSGHCACKLSWAGLAALGERITAKLTTTNFGSAPSKLKIGLLLAD